jgi:hypothetical protein
MVRFKQVTGTASPALYTLLSSTLPEAAATQGTIDKNEMIDNQCAMESAIAIARE